MFVFFSFFNVVGRLMGGVLFFHVCVLAQDHVIVVATCSLFNMVV